MTAFSVVFLCANLNAQTRSYSIRNRTDAFRSEFRYPAVYAELDFDGKSSSDISSDPACALASLVRRHPDQRLFTLDWRTEKPEILYRAHYDRQRRMLWFQKIAVESLAAGANQCFLFFGVSEKMISVLGGMLNGGNSARIPPPIKRMKNRSDRFLTKFEIALKHGIKMKALPLSDSPNFGSRRNLYP